MAKARAIIKRRKAVQNIHKITRTMQLIATARYQQAHNRAVAARPYTNKIAELVANVTAMVEAVDNPLLRSEAVAGRTAVLVLTSNRGLCGGYNASVLRIARAHLRELEGGGQKTELHAIGKKAATYFQFLGRTPTTTDVNAYERPTFAEVERIADGLLDDFTAGKIDAATVVYTRFISAGKQKAEVLRLLPLQTTAAAAEQKNESAAQVGSPYEFSPAPDALLADLLPQTVKVQLFQCFIDAAVSEQIARMVAMKSATEAAGDMIKSLSSQYNRARQSQITLELLDIMGGAEALK